MPLVTASEPVHSAASVVEAMQPVAAAIGGFGALGSVLGYALEMRKDEPQWDRAAAIGGVWGGLFGAGLLLADMLLQR